MLHGLAEPFECVADLGRVELFEHVLHLVELAAEVVVAHLVVLHLLPELAHLLLELLGLLAHGVLLAEEFFDLAAVLPVRLDVLAEVLAQPLEALAGRVGVLREVFQRLDGRVALGGEVVQALGEGGVAEGEERRARGLAAAAVVVGDLPVELDGVAGAGARHAPVDGHVLVQGARADAQAERAGGLRGAAARDAVHQPSASEAEVVGDAEDEAAGALAERPVGALDERDLGLAVRQYPQPVARRVGVLQAALRAQVDGVRPGAAQAEGAQARLAAEAEGDALAPAVLPRHLQPRRDGRRAAVLDLHAHRRADQPGRVADAFGQRAGAPTAVARRDDGHLDAAHERAVDRADGKPGRPHAVGLEAVAEVGVDGGERVEEAVAVGLEADRLSGALVGPAELQHGHQGQLAADGPGADLECGAARHLGVAGRDEDLERGGRGEVLARRHQPLGGGGHGAGPAREGDEQERQRHERPLRRRANRPEGADPLEGNVGHLLLQRGQRERVEAVVVAGVVAVGEVEERREAVVDAREVLPGAADDRAFVEAGQHAQAAQQGDHDGCPDQGHQGGDERPEQRRP